MNPYASPFKPAYKYREDAEKDAYTQRPLVPFSQAQPPDHMMSSYHHEQAYHPLQTSFTPVPTPMPMPTYSGHGDDGPIPSPYKPNPQIMPEDFAPSAADHARRYQDVEPDMKRAPTLRDREYYQYLAKTPSSLATANLGSYHHVRPEADKMQKEVEALLDIHPWTAVDKVVERQMRLLCSYRTQLQQLEALQQHAAAPAPATRAPTPLNPAAREYVGLARLPPQGARDVGSAGEGAGVDGGALWVERAEEEGGAGGARRGGRPKYRPLMFAGGSI